MNDAAWPPKTPWVKIPMQTQTHLWKKLPQGVS